MTTPDANQRSTAVVGLIEADASERDELQRLVCSLGARIRCYPTAEEFLAARHGERVSCLLVSESLPGMSGTELLRQLRTLGDAVPVVLLSAESDVSTAVAAMRAGASDFIEKPYTPATVLKRVRRVLHDAASGAPR